MSAFAQTVTGDLDISTGNLRVETSVAQCTAWKLSNLFAFFKGEWFRDKRVGLPIVQYVLVANPNLELIGSIFDRVIRSAPGIASVGAVALDYRPGARQLGATFTAFTNDGAKLTGGLGVPFIVNVKAGS